jgi:hypothetical protein
MGGFEIRPVSAADLEELLSGRCECGCSAPTPAVEALLARYPVGAPAGVVGMEFDFAANADGRWAPSWAAFEVELDRLDAAQRAVLARGKRPLSALSDGEQFVFGVWAASQWTLGQADKPPLVSQPAPVSNDVIAVVVAAAERVIRAGSPARGPVAQGFAVGVRAWMLWIIGRAPAIVYPPA